jgi:hypothetical protein
VRFALGVLNPANPGASVITDPNSGVILFTEAGPVSASAWCDSMLGQWLSPSYCEIPSVTETAQYVNQEMAATGLTPANQAAATIAGGSSLSADQAANPSGYIAQAAANAYPTLSNMLGPSVVGSALGFKPDGTQNAFSGWGIYAIAAIVAIGVMALRR